MLHTAILSPRATTSASPPPEESSGACLLPPFSTVTAAWLLLFLVVNSISNTFPGKRACRGEGSGASPFSGHSRILYKIIPGW